MVSKLNSLYRILLQEKPRKSDAVVWPQGDRYDRADNVIKMYKSRLANKVIISGNNILIGPHTRVNEDNITLKEMENHLLAHGVDSDSIVVDEGPLNTKEQAISIAKLIKKNGWRNITLIGSAYGQPRTFLTFLKQFKLANINANIHNYPAVIASGSLVGGRKTSIEELMMVESEKIKVYKGDICSIAEGIEYLKNRK